MKYLNALFRLFGYEWVKDERPIEHSESHSDPTLDEDWEALYEHSPRYRLQKIQSPMK